MAEGHEEINDSDRNRIPETPDDCVLAKEEGIGEETDLETGGHLDDEDDPSGQNLGEPADEGGIADHFSELEGSEVEETDCEA